MLTVIFTHFSLLTQALPDVTSPPIQLGFVIPTFAEVLTFIIRLFFIVAGLIAVIYLLLGAFTWITSGGNKENVDKAREKIQAAVIGLVLIFFVLAAVVLIEKTLFPAGSGLGISEPIKFPKLIK
jgi:hypothetical protein